MSFRDATAHARCRSAQRAWRGWTNRHRWSLGTGSALLLPPLLARSAEAASQPTPGCDLWAAATVCLQRYGRLGTAVLVGLAVVGWVLDKTEGLEALLRLLGLNRKPPEPPPVHQSETHGTNSPVITGGTFTPEGNQFIGGEHTHLPSPSPMAGSSTTVEVSGTGNATLTNVVAARDVIVSPTIHNYPKQEAPPKGTPCNLRFRSIGSLFKGRAPLMEQLEAATRPVALIGQGGVGKTRLAIEHAWKQVASRQAVLLVSADSPEAVNRNLAGLCGPQALDLPEKEEREEAIQRTAALQWLQAHPGWLVILDSVDTPEAAAAVEALLPHLAAGQVVITTRQSNWSAAVQGMAVDVLEPEDAREFLLERTASRRRKTDGDANTAEAIAVNDLGRLALALEQAGAYISERRLSLVAYRKEWQSNREAVLRWLDPRLMQYNQSLATTWLTSYLQVEPPARTLLRRLAWFSPEPIPESLLEVEVPGDPQAAPGARDALRQLEAYSLVAISSEAPFFSLHRLVQEVARLWQEQSEQPEPHELQAALDWLNTAFICDPQDVRNWPVLEPLEPHAKAVVGFADQQGIAKPTSQVLGELAVLLLCKADFADAEPFYRRALAIDEASYGPNHPNVARDLNNLVGLLKATNRLADAEPLMRRALAIDETSYGPNHPTVARDLNNLAALLQDNNRLEEAEPLMRRALMIDEASYGPNHPRVAIHLNNLAMLLKDTNRLEEAEPLMRRALAIDEASYGPSHPDVAISLNNLAQLLQATNRLEEAEPLMRQALAVDEASYGPNHPTVARDLNNLGWVLKETNRLEEAEPLMRRALVIDEASYGPNHPDVAINLNNLASLLQHTNRMEEAEPLMRRALAIDEASYGPNHPTVARDLNNLAQLMQDINRLEEAEPLMRRALAIDEASYGPNHPTVAIDLNNLAQMLQVTNRLEEAEPLMARAFAIFLRSLGLDHPNTQTVGANYRKLLHAQGLTDPEIQAKLQSLLASPTAP